MVDPPPDPDVFVDTGYVIALEDAADENHRVAQRHRQGMRDFPFMLTITYVLDEILTFFNVRGHHDKAIEIGQLLLSSLSFTLVHVDENLLRQAFDLLRERKDKRYSLTDCVSFVVMKEREIHVAYAFDRHFEQEEFVWLPHRD